MSEFSHSQSLCSKAPTKIANYLEDVGDTEAAARFRSPGGSGQGLAARAFDIDQYAYTGILLGYIAPTANGTARGGRLVSIDNAMGLAADLSLKDSRIKVTLDKFFVQSFPGFGTHEILCEFTGKNQIRDDPEEMRFALTTEANDGSSAAITGAPVFLGVSVGKNGIALEGRTINVRSSVDELLVQTLGSNTFQNGLALLTSAQPALKPFVGLTGSVVKAVASRSKNCQVFSFKLGLDFGSGVTSVRLRHGSYIVVQADAETWDWSQHAWNVDSQSVVQRKGGHQIRFNYMVIGVSAFTD